MGLPQPRNFSDGPEIQNTRRCMRWLYPIYLHTLIKVVDLFSQLSNVRIVLIQVLHNRSQQKFHNTFFF